LGEGEHGPAVDTPRTGDHAIPRNALGVHAEVIALMQHEPVELCERALVEKHFEPLPRRLLTRLVLPLDALPPAPRFGGVMAAMEFFEAVLERHEDGSLACLRWACARWSIGARQRESQ
jgi:hypothetical protein